jgi:uncharacterized protein YqeY
MTTARERIEADLKSAMKERDTARVATLRMLLAAVKNRAIETGEEIDDDELVALVRKQIKQREDSVRQYREGGREQLAAKEEQEIAFLEPYMPEQVGDDEIRAAIEEYVAAEGLEGPRAMGPVMKAMMARFGASADGGTISRIAREVLGG